ncbi:hypothetical protein [Sporosarcina cyprini]|uniref:hypothetical protein n=1 Tax=Sporosarcina cyprini TaxID=2910523 RepID=UPI001EDEE582|nr:hypothetical protein [Sporosarcina cyprini]MCG3089654.1 hypothetical protein [Sporosarcina cyprini]
MVCEQGLEYTSGRVHIRVVIMEIREVSGTIRAVMKIYELFLKYTSGPRDIREVTQIIRAVGGIHTL